MVHVRNFTRKHDWRGPNGQLPCILDRQRLPRTLRDHVWSASALSALKKSLVANLSAKRQLAVAKLFTKRILSLAKQDFLVANGRMAADFSSPDIWSASSPRSPAWRSRVLGLRNPRWIYIKKPKWAQIAVYDPDEPWRHSARPALESAEWVPGCVS